MAGVKITDLGTLTTAASDDLLYIVDVSDNTSGPQGTSKAIEVGDLRSYKVYTALLTQDGNPDIAPTAIELENTIGTVNWFYNGVGNYYCALSISTTTNTFCIATNNDTAQNFNFGFLIIGCYVNGQVSIANYNAGGDSVDGFYQAIEIRVYN